jgi:nitrite reductase/ring-hydroxylating ferredoxin subunit
MRTSADALVRQLANAGYTIREFSMVSTGDYSVEDADWNYKDIPHLNVVHTLVRTMIGTLDDDVITTVNLQKILGLPFPLVVVNYATGKDSQTYFTTFGPYVLIVHTRYEALAPNRVQVVTTYHIAGSRLAMLAFPLLRRILVKNYRVLMSEDIPMRDQRGRLREHGFSFRSDGRPRTFPETADLQIVNVIVPTREGSATQKIALSQFANESDCVLVGESDDRGLRITRQGSELLAFPRFCDHEGASLDCSDMRNGRLRCPWHAKMVAPLIRLAVDSPAEARSGAYALRIEGEALCVEVPAANPAYAHANGVS